MKLLVLFMSMLLFPILTISVGWATPQTATINLGSNPIFNEIQHNANVSDATEQLLLTAPTDQVLIITGYQVKRTISCGYASDSNASLCDASFSINGNTIADTLSTLLQEQQNLTLKLEAGESLSVTPVRKTSCSTMKCTYYLQGYYATP